MGGLEEKNQALAGLVAALWNRRDHVLVEELQLDDELKELLVELIPSAKEEM